MDKRHLKLIDCTGYNGTPQPEERIIVGEIIDAFIQLRDLDDAIDNWCEKFDLRPIEDGE